MRCRLPALLPSSDPEPDLGAADQCDVPGAVADAGRCWGVDLACQTGTTTPMPSHNAGHLAAHANAVDIESDQCPAVDMTLDDATEWQIVNRSRRTMRASRVHPHEMDAQTLGCAQGARACGRVVSRLIHRPQHCGGGRRWHRCGVDAGGRSAPRQAFTPDGAAYPGAAGISGTNCTTG